MFISELFTPREVNESSAFRQRVEQQQYNKIERIKLSSLKDYEKEYLIAISDPTGKPFKAGYYSYNKGMEAMELVKTVIAQKYNISPDILDDVELRDRANALHGNRMK